MYEHINKQLSQSQQSRLIVETYGFTLHKEGELNS